jgi:hypothetical protein
MEQTLERVSLSEEIGKVTVFQGLIRMKRPVAFYLFAQGPQGKILFKGTPSEVSDHWCFARVSADIAEIGGMIIVNSEQCPFAYDPTPREGWWTKINGDTFWHMPIVNTSHCETIFEYEDGQAVGGYLQFL